MFLFQMDAILLNVNFIKESQKKKNQEIKSSTTVFNVDNKKCFWSTNQHIRMISKGSHDTED